MSSYPELAVRERSLAKAAAERAGQARLDAANAAFQDTAEKLGRQADEEDRAARSHLEAAREYERLAAESPAAVATATVDEETSRNETESERGEGGFALWRRRRHDVQLEAEGSVGADPEIASADVPDGDERVRFFEFSRDMLCLAGFDGYFKLLNEAWERTLGYPRDELLTQPYIDYVHPADVERTSAEAASLATAGADTVHFRNRYRAKDGSYRWLEWSARSDTTAGLIYAIARDVTSQQRVAEVQSRLSAIVRSSTDGIYGLSPEGVVTSWNLGAERLYGYSPGEIVGQPLSRLIPAERFGEDRELLQKVLAGETADHVETSRVRKDGSTFEASLSISPILDAESRITGASVSARDISTTKEAEREREQADQRFRAAFDDAPTGMALVRPDGACLEVNLALLEATGYTRAAVLAMDFATLLDPVSRETYRDHMKQALTAPPRTLRMSATLLRSGGEAVPAVLNMSVIRDYLGQPLHFVCHVITDQD
jgi:PAS domain S-box-containing protein